MPAASADHSPRTGRPLLWAVGFVLLVLVVAVVVVALRGDREVVTPAAPEKSESPVELTRADHAAAMLGDLARALEEGTRREALALAAPREPEARRSLGVIYDNVQDLDVSGLALRFVDEAAGSLSREDRRTFGRRAWVGDVALRWRLAGYDDGTASMEVSFTFVDTPDGVAFGSAGGDGESPAPLWLLEDLTVGHRGRAMVAVAERQQLGRYSRLAAEAVRDVRAVLPQWQGRLVVEVPAAAEDLGRMLDAQPDAYASIAAVTATVDGSLSPGSPVHIMVNPEVFADLGEEGSQIVMSHEATHVAVDAATATMPLWLLEGFADYVALARSDLPVSVTGSQILAEVRRDGPPKQLPGASEFDPSNKLLGTSYEAAWLACRLIAEEYGEKRLVAFYESVDEGSSIEDAFDDLGTTQRAFTRQWRGYLRELAG